MYIYLPGLCLNLFGGKYEDQWLIQFFFTGSLSYRQGVMPEVDKDISRGTL